MTMISVRLDDEQFDRLSQWADTLEIDRSTFVRDAIRRRIAELQGPLDVDRWLEIPLDDGERALDELDEWGPAEDWSDWA